MTITAKVDTHKLSPQAGLCVPGYNPINANSPAIEAMTDFSRITPVTVSGDATLGEAHAAMVSRGVRLLMVTGHDGGLIGLITARDVLGERPMQIAQSRHGKREDLTVKDLMVPRAQIDTLYMSDVMNARVTDILRALKQQGRQHILVEDVDPLSAVPRVRGIFSATQIGRQLGVPVLGFDLPQNFAEIEAALAH